MRLHITIVFLVIISSSATSQITGKWKYKNSKTTLVAQIQEQDELFYGEIIEATPKKYEKQYLGIFMTNFKKKKPNKYTGNFVIDKKQQYKGTLKIINKNTIELSYKWGMLTQKDTWTKIK
ncbi:hypothetical protein WH52_11215 [Tenacibaculum holothuriorum]|uniref:Uncharacterized protein n=2 Tax=Tenacibaculum holothuriorum TaxID=1635173 RepID=A0A1Y2PCM9_9FLAO|nr:hypothetical protein WH52_11215 [Tenacibaculum holothuriorum]